MASYPPLIRNKGRMLLVRKIKYADEKNLLFEFLFSDTA
nr:hypothetical protein [Mucilaginibacter sp. FT3.2]